MHETVAPILIKKHSLPNGPSFNMVQVEGGTFMMGAEKEEAQKSHEVKLDSFLIGQHPVTQGLYEAVMGGNPAYFKGPERPIEQVNWYDAVSCCNELSKQMGLAPFYDIDKSQKDPNNQSSIDEEKWLVTPIPESNGFRLPTEAEWEYAARGGRYAAPSLLPFAGSEHLKNIGWYDINSQNQSHATGIKVPNELGLYDMSGNVWEWCWDWYGTYSEAYQENPKGQESGHYRVRRGGSWLDNVLYARVADRSLWYPDNRFHYLGFRLARTV